MTASQSSGKAKKAAKDNYSIVAAGKNYPVLKCHVCGEFPPLKSNKAIVEEYDRLSEYLRPKIEDGCSNDECENAGIGISQGSSYYASFGKTKAGSKRYRCKVCKNTFFVGSSTLRQKQPHKNKLIFSLLMNKMPLKRICETADIQMPSIYGKITFLRNQCLLF